MPLLLNVPFCEKDAVKSLGAKWNSKIKRWYVTDKNQYYKFKKWFVYPHSNIVICDHFYIIVAKQLCFKCKKETRVVSLATDSYLTFNNGNVEVYNDDINFIKLNSVNAEQLLKHLNNNYDFYKGYSNTTKTHYWGNHCDHCGVLQGNWFLYSEPDSPFFMNSEEKATALDVFK